MATVLHPTFNSTTATMGAPAVQSQAQESNPLVLIVEDHEDTRFLLTCLLEMRGCRVACAEDGETAVSVAAQMHPDLILMDVTLPRLDGLAATRRIRQTPALERVPLIFLSGHAQLPFQAEARAAGGTDFLVKPFQLTQLESLLDTHLAPRLTGQAT